MKKVLLIVSFIIVFTLLVLFLLPHIKFNINDKIVYINYDGSIDEFDKNHCYHESVSYDEKRDISITNFDIKKHFIFYVITLSYEEGNLCDNEYVLEEEYIKDFIDNAIIEYNDKNIDIKSLIEGKTAIVSNTRYLGNDYETSIYYTLNGKDDVMYIFYNDDLLIIQVGYPDETTRFIAYR